MENIFFKWGGGGKHKEIGIFLRKKLIITLKNINNGEKQQHSGFVAFVENF